MGIDEMGGYEADEGAESGGNKSEALSEKYRESVKKGGAGVKRVQKDEQKAKKYDFFLAEYLAEIIKDSRYDPLLDYIFALLDKEVPSNFVLGVLSLVYMPISDKIRFLNSKEKIKFDYNNSTRVEFDDNNLDDKLKDRINLWVEDMMDIISINESSSIMTNRLINSIELDEDILNFVSFVFIFFLDAINMDIREYKSRSYSRFILGELGHKLKCVDIEEV